VEAEIMQVVAEEARESYAEGVVHEVPSNAVEDVESNAARVEAWLAAWKADHPDGVASGPAAAGAAGGAGAETAARGGSAAAQAGEGSDEDMM
jgi:hypothetical protein